MRYADEHTKKPQDFQARHRLPSVVQFFLIFIALYTFLMAYFLISNNTFGFGIWAFLLLAGCAGFMTYMIRFNRDLIMATEFQNAIFANAVGVNYVFSIITRSDGSIVYVDRGLQDFFTKFSRTKHRNLSDLFEIAEVSEEHQNAIMHTLQSETQERLLFDVTLANGTKKELVLSIDPIVKPSNFSLLRAREYSDKRAEASPSLPAPRYDLSASMAGLSEKLPIGMLSASSRGDVIYTNPNFDSYLGYEKGEIVARKLSIEQIIADPLKVFGEADTQGYAVYRHKLGGTIKLYTLSHIEMAGDVVVSMGAIVYPPENDMQAKPENTCMSEQAVQSAPTQSAVVMQHAAPLTDADFASTFLDQAPIAIIQIDSVGNITYLNEAFKKLIGRQQHKLPDRLTDIVPPIKKEETAQMIQQVLNGAAGHSHMQIDFELPGGAPVAVSVYASKTSQIAGATFYLIDVTEQKNLELRFAHSQKMQAVGQLAGGVAHDFNNLLTAMIGFSDLLLMRHPAGDQSFADIMQIKQNANRAANLVRQLLAFSRRQTLQPKNLDVTDLLAELSNLIRRLIGENIELKMIHGRDLDMVKADQGQLEQVVINLAVNARDAMKTGGVLTIRSSKVAISRTNPIPRRLTAPVGEDGNIPDGDYILIEVSDTGTGIPASVMPKIFEPFFSTKEIGSGTGLGLSTVYGIIKQTGGYIFVSSAENVGTQFNIYFPAFPMEEGAKLDEADNIEKSGQDLTGRETLLLVEDETPVRAFATRALKNKGYTVFEADCAEAGLELVRDHGSKLDLIITDVIMPGMNGPTMVEKISEEYPDIKVIFISGYAEDIFMNNYGSERSFNFLAKPFTLKQLASKVKEVLVQK